MTEIKVLARKWGDYIAVIIPKKIAENKNIKPEDEITIKIEKENGLKEIFGTLGDWKINSQKIKDELRRGWK